MRRVGAADGAAVYRGWMLTVAQYAELYAALDYGDLATPSVFAELARRLRSRFFTLDVALREDGVWRVVQMGDAQVSGLPDDASAAAFYGALAQRFAR